MSGIIDIHSHILPCVDDGSKDVETTLKMLRLAAEQNIEWMAATPHFRASRDRLELFLSKRQKAWETVCEILPNNVPRIVLGAEVAYFQGMSRADGLDELTFGNTRVILLEMPFTTWTQSQIDEVRYMVEYRKLRVIFAHLERYMDIPENRRLIRQIWELPVYIQINSESLSDWRKRGKLIRLFRDGKAHFLGSDCHGVDHRPPDLLTGRNILKHKLGEEFLDHMDAAAGELLGM